MGVPSCGFQPRGDTQHGDPTVVHFVAQLLDGGQVATDPVQPIYVQPWGMQTRSWSATATQVALPPAVEIASGTGCHDCASSQP